MRYEYVSKILRKLRNTNVCLDFSIGSTCSTIGSLFCKPGLREDHVKDNGHFDVRVCDSHESANNELVDLWMLPVVEVEMDVPCKR